MIKKTYNFFGRWVWPSKTKYTNKLKGCILYRVFSQNLLNFWAPCKEMPVPFIALLQIDSTEEFLSAEAIFK